MAIVCLVIIFMWPKVTKKIPGSLVVIVLATIVSIILANVAGLKCDTIGQFVDGRKHYSIPTTLPSPKLPDFSLATLKTVLPTAVSPITRILNR